MLETKFFTASNQTAESLLALFKKLEDSNISKSEDYNSILHEMKTLSIKYRRIMKELGANSKVEVEPDLLTFILDQVSLEHNEVVYTVCPGAGGYDAACIISTKELSQENLNKTLEKLSNEIREKGT